MFALIFYLWKTCETYNWKLIGALI